MQWRHKEVVLSGEDITTTYDNSRATQKVTSSFLIDEVTIENLGLYTCSISNRNFGNPQSKTFEVSYTSQITITDQPKVFYFSPEETLTWVVSGWPLDDVALSCKSKESSEYYNINGIIDGEYHINS